MKIEELFDENTCKKLRERLDAALQDIRARGLIEFRGKKRLTGYSYGELYDWDLYFENVFLSHFGVSEYCRNGIELFLDQQTACGFIPRTAVNPRWRQHFKPFLAQITLLGSRQSGDFGWLSGRRYDQLKTSLEYWFWYCDLDKNGLCVWDSADHSGMDNQDRRAGRMYQADMEGADLNSYLVRELRAMAAIAGELGLHGDANNFEEHARKLSGLVNELLWDERDEFYYDRNERTGEYAKVKTIAGFTPLWSGIAPQNRADALIRRHLMNPDEFWRPFPVATWSKGEPDYYQQPRGDECNWMGTAWIPTNYMVFHGLMNYGYTSLAKELAEKTFFMALGNDHTREYYDAETGRGYGLDPFWGWSLLAYMMPLEFAESYDPTEIGLKQPRMLAAQCCGMPVGI